MTMYTLLTDKLSRNKEERGTLLTYGQVQRIRTGLILIILIFLISHFLLNDIYSGIDGTQTGQHILHSEDVDCKQVQHEYKEEGFDLNRGGKVVALTGYAEGQLQGELVFSGKRYMNCLYKDDYRFDLNMGRRVVALTGYAEGQLQGKLVFRPYMNCLYQDDYNLVSLVKQEYIKKPNDLQYEFPVPMGTVDTPQQTTDVIELVYGGANNIPKDGFFIEAGSYDGFTSSISLEFEVLYGWKGLLVEAHPSEFVKQLAVNRKAYQANTCLGLYQHPHYAHFDLISAVRTDTHVNSMPGLSQIPNKDSVTMQVQCLPLFTLIKALGNPKVNLLVLDVEGAELKVLHTLPWDEVDIEIMSIDSDLVGMAIPGGSQDTLREFVVSKGYTRFDHRTPPNKMTGKPQNDLFVRNDVMKRLNLKKP